jgi:hypothetical protein
VTVARFARPVAVASVGAVSGLGFEWRGLGAALAESAFSFGEAAALKASHPGALASEVPAIPAAFDAGDARQHKLMARGARLAAVAARRALAGTTLAGARDGVGYYLGVGASGGAMSDLLAVIQASLDGDHISIAKLGDKGLSATNPVATFQLLNNFMMCHSAILEGTGGPNGTFFSRGAGTVLALMEAVCAISEGDCLGALAGGADSALHPVTWAELLREGYAERGLVPGEGACVLALAPATDAEAPIAYIDHCSIHWAGGPASPLDLSGLLEGIQSFTDSASPQPRVDLVVLAPWGDRAREALRAFARSSFPEAPMLDSTARLGDALAATPALAWAAALDQIACGAARRALVLSAGIDGQVGAVVLSKDAARRGGLQ